MAFLPAYLLTSTLSVLSPTSLDQSQKQGFVRVHLFLAMYPPPSRKLNLCCPAIELFARNFLRMRYFICLFLIRFNAIQCHLSSWRTLPPYHRPLVVSGAFVGRASQTKPLILTSLPRHSLSESRARRPRASRPGPSSVH